MIRWLIRRELQEAWDRGWQRGYLSGYRTGCDHTLRRVIPDPEPMARLRLVEKERL